MYNIDHLKYELDLPNEISLGIMQIQKNVLVSWIYTGRDYQPVVNRKWLYDSHNYHDENHDEIELYLGNSDRSTWLHSTPEQRAPKNQSDWLWLRGAADQCTMSQVPISIPWHREYWNIQLKAHLKPYSIKSSNTPAWPYQLLVCMSLRKGIF